MNYAEYERQARAISAAADIRIKTTPPPVAQKYPPGSRVRIADDLGPTMRHFPHGREATVLHTYAHAFGGDDVQSYALDVDGRGFVAWYYERQLTAVADVLEAEFVG